MAEEATDSAVVDAAVAAGTAAGQAAVAAEQATEAAQQADQATAMTEAIAQAIGAELLAVNERLTNLEANYAMMQERIINLETPPEKKTEANETTTETHEPVASETTEQIQPAGDPTETITVSHGRRFRRI